MPQKVSRLAFAVFLLSTIFFSGCGTLKGAAEGFKEDWKAAERVDAWMRKNLW